MVTVKDIGDKGSETPTRGYNSFMRRPTNMSEVILRPTENTTVFTPFRLLGFNILRSNTPGTKTR